MRGCWRAVASQRSIRHAFERLLPQFKGDLASGGSLRITVNMERPAEPASVATASTFHPYKTCPHISPLSDTLSSVIDATTIQRIKQLDKPELFFIAHASSAGDYDIVDVSPTAKFLATRDVQKNAPLWKIIRRGLSYGTTTQDAEHTGETFVLRRGYPKFGEACFGCIFSLLAEPDASLAKRRKLSSPTGGHKQQPHRLEHCQLSGELVTRVQEFARMAVEASFDVYAMEKLNGTNAQVAWCANKATWVCASKNVSVVARSVADLECPVYCRRRFRYARLIARTWFGVLDVLTPLQVDRLKELLSSHTLVGELVGIPGSQHLVHYSKTELRWFGCVPHTGSCISWAPAAMNMVVERVLGEAAGTSPLQLSRCYEEICDLSAKQIPDALVSLTARMELASLTDCGEGAVLYIVGRCRCEDSAKGPALKQSAVLETGCLHHDFVLGLVKAKTLEYVLLRRIREKCRNVARLQENGEPPRSIPRAVAEYEAQARALVSRPATLNTRVAHTIKKYVSTFEACLQRLQYDKPAFMTSEWINLNFLDFVEVASAPVKPLSHPLATGDADTLTVGVHLVVPPFVLTPTAYTAIENAVVRCCPNDPTIVWRVHFWSDPLESSSHFLSNEKTAEKQPNIVFFWGYDAEGIARAKRIAVGLLRALGPARSPTADQAAVEDATITMPSNTSVECWSLERLAAAMAAPKPTLAAAEVVANAVGYVDGPPTAEREPVLAEVWESSGVHLSATTMMLLQRENSFTLPHLLDYYLEKAEELKKQLIEAQENQRKCDRAWQLRCHTIPFIPDCSPRLFVEQHLEECTRSGPLTLSAALNRIAGIVRSCLHACGRDRRRKQDSLRLSSAGIGRPLAVHEEVLPPSQRAGLPPIMEVTYLLPVAIPGSGKSTLLKEFFQTGRNLCRGGTRHERDAEGPVTEPSFQHFERDLPQLNEASDGQWKWDATGLFSADAYTLEALGSGRALPPNPQQFSAARREGVQKQVEDLQAFLQTEVLQLLIAKAREQEQFAGAAGQDVFSGNAKTGTMRPVRVLLMMDKNTPPPAIEKARALVLSFLRALFEAKSPPASVTHDDLKMLYGRTVRYSVQLVLYSGSAQSMAGFLAHEKDGPTNGNEGTPGSLQTGQTASRSSSPGTSLSSARAWPFFWDPDVVSECVYRVVTRCDHATLQGPQAIHTVLSFLTLHRHWSPNLPSQGLRDERDPAAERDRAQDGSSPYSLAVVPFFRSSSDPAWYALMGHLIRGLLATPQFKPFRDPYLSDGVYARIAALCFERKAARSEPAEKQQLRSTLPYLVDLLLATLNMDAPRWTEVPWDHRQAAGPCHRVSESKSKPPRLPLYTFIDLTQDPTVTTLTSAFTRVAAPLFGIPEASLAKELQTELHWVKSPHITLHHYGQDTAPQPGGAASDSASAPPFLGLREALHAQGRLFQCRVDYMIYIRKFILIASVTPLHPVSIGSECPSSECGSGRASCAPAYDAVPGSGTSELPAAPGKYLHITLATGRQVKPFVSNVVLHQLQSLLLQNANESGHCDPPRPGDRHVAAPHAFYRTPGDFNHEEYPQQCFDTIKRLLWHSARLQSSKRTPPPVAEERTSTAGLDTDSGCGPQNDQPLYLVHHFDSGAPIVQGVLNVVYR